MTTLYRLYAADGALLYVGIAESWPSRMKQHAREKPWWEEVHDVRLTHYGDRTTAEAEEVRAIKAEKPRHNVVHAGRSLGATYLPKNVEWVVGTGRWAVLAHCRGVLTVTRHPWKNQAKRALQQINRTGCGHGCTRHHEIWYLDAAKKTA